MQPDERLPRSAPARAAGQKPRRLEPVAFPTGAALAESVASFLRAFDHGHLGSFGRCGGEDSAWITDMREQLAAYRADRALVTTLQDGSAA